MEPAHSMTIYVQMRCSGCNFLPLQISFLGTGHQSSCQSELPFSMLSWLYLFRPLLNVIVMFWMKICKGRWVWREKILKYWHLCIKQWKLFKKFHVWFIVIFCLKKKYCFTRFSYVIISHLKASSTLLACMPNVTPMIFKSFHITHKTIGKQKVDMTHIHKGGLHGDTSSWKELHRNWD